MKKFAIALAATALLTGSAFAADLPTRGPVYKAAPMAPAPVYNWTGCYVGAGGGYGMYNQDINNPVDAGFEVIDTGETLTLGGRGWFGTVQAGCDYQIAQNFVIGVFGDYDFSNIKGHIFDVDEKLKSSWAVGGRLGYVIFPQLLGYVSGGYTEARFDAIPECSGCSSNLVDEHTYHGWFIGTGYEYQLAWLSPNLTWKTEYRFSSYRKDALEVFPGECDGSCGTIDAEKWVQTVRSELVFRFNFWR